jgi:2-amino-4-hydroxy-6-hydroxymethyldihydropteridine diphosphokinase
MPVTYIGLGSNLNNPSENIRRAFTRLTQEPGIILVEQSPIYASDPEGEGLTGRFANAVAQIDTDLPPSQLLKRLEIIEREFGRDKRNDASRDRTLDLDILLYSDLEIDMPGLTVPHPCMAGRRFVMQPLADLAPQLVLPVAGKTVTELLAAIPDPQLEKID